MQTTITGTQVGLVDEHQAAKALGLSVHTLRKDRQHQRRIPYLKLGGTVRYNLERVFEAVAAYELGGPQIRSRRAAR